MSVQKVQSDVLSARHLETMQLYININLQSFSESEKATIRKHNRVTNKY